MHHRISKHNIVWTVLFSILAALALNACSDTNNVTGPPPPVPLSPDAKLSNLTVNTGPLDPTFSSEIDRYTVNVATSVASVTVTAQPQNANASMTINGQATASGQVQTIPLGGAGSNTPIQIVVTAVNGSQNTYIVDVNRAPPGGNNNLRSLTVSSSSLTPSFTASTTIYAANVVSSVNSVTVAAQPQDAGATVNINGQTTTSRSVSLGQPGSGTAITIVVTAPNGSQNTYVVTVNRAAPGGNNSLRSLTVSSGSLSPAFTASTTTYAVNVASSVDRVTVAAQPQEAGATVNINGQTTTSLSVPLGAEGSSTPITIVVTAPNGTQNTYVVTVNRAALGGNSNLRNLTVSSGSLAPPFAANRTSYTVNVVSSVNNVIVAAQPQDTGATVNINGQTTTSLSVPLGAEGSSTSIPIVVTAPNGSQNTYIVTVNRAALGGNDNLLSLTVSSGSLAPPFAVNRTNYRVNVANSVNNVIVAAQPQDTGATVTINGQTTTSLSVPLGPEGSSTEIQIEVRAPNGNDKTYTVDVNRALPSGNNNLSALSVSAGALDPTFSAANSTYDVTTPTTTESTTVTATVEDSTATLTIDGSTAISGMPSAPITLAGEQQEIRIVVTAANGTPNTYIVNIIRKDD